MDSHFRSSGFILRLTSFLCVTSLISFPCVFAQQSRQSTVSASSSVTLESSAETGDAHAQHNLGWLYFKGLGVSFDYRESARWERLAAEQGDHRAQTDLAYLYESGRGVPLDYVAAYTWYSRAVAGGEKTAVERRKSLSHIMTQRQLDQANARKGTEN